METMSILTDGLPHHALGNRREVMISRLA